MTWRTPSRRHLPHRMGALGILAASLLAAACTTTGGGGGTGASFVGGPVGGVCNPTYNDEGCHYDVAAKGYERVTCTADTTAATGGKWAQKAACGAGQLCKEIVQQGSSKKSTECYDPPVQSVPDTTSGGSDGTSSGKDGSSNADVSVASVLTCLKTQCNAEYSACKADAKCGAGLTCAEACKDDTCTKACTSALSEDPKFGALVTCGLPKKCFGDISTGPECGNGQCESGETTSSCPADCKTTTNPVCGDGQCNGSETPSTCPADCKTTTTGKCGDLKCTSPENIETCSLDCDTSNFQTISCLQSACGPQTSACIANTDCVKFLSCAAACKGNSSCQSSCLEGVSSSAQGLVINLGQCGQTNKCLGGDTGPVCGNGTCESGETTSSCPSDCKTTTKCGNGTCDSGETTSSCPADCKTTSAKCGDLQCSTGEASTCPLDCNSAYLPSISCIAEVCGSAWTTCKGDPKCIAFLNCSIKCNCDSNCIQTCGSAAGSSSGLVALSQCSGASECQGSNPCGSSGPVCGNGTCESGETTSSCPSDCKTSTKCGNGTCDSGETASSCPSDCKSSTKKGCVADPNNSTGGCGGCACESCVVAKDSWCGESGWDSTCASECAECNASYCQ